jgi:hypothetical protein
MSMDFHGFPWTSMDAHGYPWMALDFRGCQSIPIWISIYIQGYPFIDRFGLKLEISFGSVSVSYGVNLE